MRYTITRAIKQDAETIADLLWQSKQYLTINRLLFYDWPAEEVQRKIYGGAVRGAFENDDGGVRRWKVVYHPRAHRSREAVDDEEGGENGGYEEGEDDGKEMGEQKAGEGDEVVGYVVLSHRKPTPSSNQGEEGEGEEGGNKGGKRGGKGGKAGVPEGMNPDVFNAVMKAVAENGKRWEGVEHLELTHIFILPAHWKKGLGTRLVNLCIEAAEAEGLPLVLVSEPQVHPFLVKMGFKDTGFADLDLAKWTGEFEGFGMFRLWDMIWKRE